jgi:hypothetical protein
VATGAVALQYWWSGNATANPTVKPDAPLSPGRRFSHTCESTCKFEKTAKPKLLSSMFSWRSETVIAPDSPRRSCLLLPEGFVSRKVQLMDRNTVTFLLTCVGIGCWVVCFWWMHRISTKQNKLLEQLRTQNKRIENLSEMEHELIKELHPQVGEIKDGVNEVVSAVKENPKNSSPRSR